MNNSMDSFVGTKVYAAPEILRHRPYDLRHGPTTRASTSTARAF